MSQKREPQPPDPAAAPAKQAEVDRLLRAQPPIPVPRRHLAPPAKGHVVYPILGYRVVSRLG